MSPEITWLCCTLAAGLFLAWAWHGACREEEATEADRRRWKRTTVARTEAEVQAELEEARRLVDEHVKFSRIIAAEFPTGIPHQTRRTEEDQ